MTTAIQRSLNLSISQRTVLVSVETVRASLGCDAESVFAKVDNGGLRWVFDVSVEHGGHCGTQRELRFWTGEIVAAENAAKQTETQVIAAIIGKGASVRRGEIERQWVVSAQHVMRLIKAKELALASVSHVSRASLESFLKRRLIK
ncbi:MAG TPA: hypothetical protein VG347_00825 [Verrucomicrobiae bacterium]|nr:hypothetical protein [Verrucomicrobiae bacterium]